MLSKPAARASAEGLFGLAGGVDAAEPPEHGVVETLHAKRQAVDAGLAVVVEAAVLDRAGIGLERDLDIVGRSRRARTPSSRRAICAGVETGWACRRRRTR